MKKLPGFLYEKQPSDQKHRNLTAEGCIIFREKAD